jgi:hypothetical protein
MSVVRNFSVFLGVGLMAIGLFGCGSSDSAEETPSTDIVRTHTPETLQKEIEELEHAVSDPDIPNHHKMVLQLIDFYQSYAKIFSTNELAPEMLFRAGNQAVNIEEYDLALQLYAQVEKDYREYLKRPECIFLQGFVFENYKNQLGTSKEAYERLISEYPKHILSEQAKQSISYLGMSDEERVRSFSTN